MMTPEHPRWEEFCDLLEGPDGCNFREDENGKIRWRCGGGFDQSHARRILADMGFNDMSIYDSMEFFYAHGGHCDCEILFNVR